MDKNWLGNYIREQFKFMNGAVIIEPALENFVENPPKGKQKRIVGYYQREDGSGVIRAQMVRIDKTLSLVSHSLETWK